MFDPMNALMLTLITALGLVALTSLPGESPAAPVSLVADR